MQPTSTTPTRRSGPGNRLLTLAALAASLLMAPAALAQAVHKFKLHVEPPETITIGGTTYHVEYGGIEIQCSSDVGIQHLTSSQGRMTGQGFNPVFAPATHPTGASGNILGAFNITWTPPLIGPNGGPLGAPPRTGGDVGLYAYFQAPAFADPFVPPLKVVGVTLTNVRLIPVGGGVPQETPTLQLNKPDYQVVVRDLGGKRSASRGGPTTDYFFAFGDTSITYPVTLLSIEFYTSTVAPSEDDLTTTGFPSYPKTLIASVPSLVVNPGSIESVTIPTPADGQWLLVAYTTQWDDPGLGATVSMDAIDAHAPLACPPDVDGDDDVDVFDFGQFAAAFGATGLPMFSPGDVNGDGNIDVFDFGQFAADFGCSP